MRHLRAYALGVAILTIAATGRPAVPLPDFLQVLGNVTNSARPIDNALVIAFNLTNFSAIQTFTTSDGSFTLPPLKAGIYKIIAVKQGFAPAIAMITPNKKDHKVALRLQTEKPADKSATQQMWEIRASLPPDVLRQLNMVMGMASTEAASPARFRGEMTSLTGISEQLSSPVLAQTSLDVSGQLPGGWQVGVQGDLHRMDDSSSIRGDGTRLPNTVAESTGVSMVVRSANEADTYRLASTKSWWRYRDDGEPDSNTQADVRAHNFEWQRAGNSVQVHYLAQDNLFADSPLGSEMLEVTGGTHVVQTARAGLALSVRVRQENVRNTPNSVYRTAAVTADANYTLVPSFLVHYGLSSRVSANGSEWAPRTAAEWKLNPQTSLVFNGMYKLYNDRTGLLPPSLVVWNAEEPVLPRYSYSFGFVSGDEKSHDRISAIATISESDSLMRVMFNDGFEQFWQGLYVDSGDVRRDLRLAYRKELNRFAIDVSTGGGTASNPHVTDDVRRKVYLIGDLSTIFNPTGTSLALSYRQMDQPDPLSAGLIGGPAGRNYRSERMNVRMAQSLHLPVDVRLLLGIELARAENSPLLLETVNADGVSRRYIGGLTVNF
jgi:hypothetical protein